MGEVRGLKKEVINNNYGCFALVYCRSQENNVKHSPPIKRENRKEKMAKKLSESFNDIRDNIM